MIRITYSHFKTSDVQGETKSWILECFLYQFDQGRDILKVFQISRTFDDYKNGIKNYHKVRILFNCQLIV